MTFSCIEAERRPSGVGVITLRRLEKLNALSIDMRREISLCLGSWRDADDVLAVVITGAGRAFSAGFDLDEFKQPERYRRSIDAREAHRIGLVSEVVAPGEVLGRAVALAGSIAEAPPEALRYTKSFMSQSAAADFEACFAVEHDRAFREVLLRPGHWRASPELDS